MPSILNEIGWFQFENLVKNRIPFLLINLGVDFTGLYQGFYQSHLESQMMTSNEKSALNDVKERKIPAHHAILVVCQDGSQSALVIDQLESAGYLNVFYAKAGLTGLLADRT